jgi:hypothetical protein
VLVTFRHLVTYEAEMTYRRGVAVALAVVVAVLLALAASGCGSSKKTASSAARGTSRAYAYLVPLNPTAPSSGQWATRVSQEKIQAGDRFRSDPSGQLWEVVAVKPTANDGKPAAVRGWPEMSAVIRHPAHKWGNPVWAGKLVLRAVR